MRGSSQAYSTSDNSTPGMNIAEAITTSPSPVKGSRRERRDSALNAQRRRMRGSSQAYSTSDNSTPSMNIAEAITTEPITSGKSR